MQGSLRIVTGIDKILLLQHTGKLLPLLRHLGFQLRLLAGKLLIGRADFRCLEAGGIPLLLRGFNLAFQLCQLR